MSIILQGSDSWLEKGDTLICFGDSITASTNGYVGMLQEHLAAKGIKVINAGRGGDKTPWALTRLHKDVIESGGSAVSFFFGANDSIIGRGEWVNEPTVSPNTFKENLKWMVHLCRLFSSIRKFSIATPAGEMEGKLYQNYGEIRRNYCLAAREAADEAGTCLVPLDSVFRREWEQNALQSDEHGLLHTKDGIHMRESGNRLIANAMLKTWNLL
ncbi:MAG: GDSL-type esterase/lipase family protein [Victivallaceae bacterium]|jgi:lysophospholipase L1-like esterase|nr:GDSL-type esterase/lipase family protein [Victivallaceae bacterium]NLK82920.1 hypothetical protein [Lentisphaerota bacterium]MDD3116008.1 GDSL-type esterase/lipase family protein [Victivallaceae bacterium]MDD3704220.1 GDSL-type esterase/lipase family protein [Victivallaceae bacterium]MDD4318393.1 GDSL-type esterase/lipase family protein [Victivallaceae bacterium]